MPLSAAKVGTTALGQTSSILLWLLATYSHMSLRVHHPQCKPWHKFCPDIRKSWHLQTQHLTQKYTQNLSPVKECYLQFANISTFKVTATLPHLMILLHLYSPPSFCCRHGDADCCCCRHGDAGCCCCDGGHHFYGVMSGSGGLWKKRTCLTDAPWPHTYTSRTQQEYEMANITNKWEYWSKGLGIDVLNRNTLVIVL